MCDLLRLRVYFGSYMWGSVGTVETVLICKFCLKVQQGNGLGDENQEPRYVAEPFHVLTVPYRRNDKKFYSKTDAEPKRAAKAKAKPAAKTSKK